MAVIAALLEHETRCLSDPQGQIRRDDSVGAAPDAIGSEVFTHVPCLRIP
jgi:hypothetical protein